MKLLLVFLALGVLLLSSCSSATVQKEKCSVDTDLIVYDGTEKDQERLVCKL